MIFFQFQNPWLLLFLLFLPILAFQVRKDSQATINFSSLATLKALRTPRIDIYAGLPFIIRFLALTLLVIALARPQEGHKSTEILSVGVDIMLALDTSGSMRALDFIEEEKRITRLAVVKGVVSKFIENRPNDRIGMVVFGEQAYTQCPLTLDYDVLLSFLDQIRIAEKDWDGTAIGMAIINATNRLREAEGRSQVVILLTDGVNNAGEIDPLTAAEVAAAIGVRVYAIGVGAPGSGGRGRGRTVDFDEETLQQVAGLTGGRYYHATSGEKLAEIYDEIGKLETTEITSQIHVNYTERYPLFLWPCLALIMLEFVLVRTRLRTIP